VLPVGTSKSKGENAASPPQATPSKLSVEEYKLLCQRVLERDGWRCKYCGSSIDLQVHHLAKGTHLINRIRVPMLSLLPDSFRYLVIQNDIAQAPPHR
jgi:hypothetical protein